MHHLGDAIPEDRLWHALNEYEKYGLPLQLSEITILSCEMFPDWRSAHVWYDKVEAAKQAGERLYQCLVYLTGKNTRLR